jgi:hypothetical protein
MNNLFNNKSLMCVVVLAFFLVACGSDNYSSSQPPPTDVDQPLVNLHKLPIVEIDTLGNIIVDEPKVKTMMVVKELNDDGIEIVTYQGFAGLEFRGASSQSFDKKSYGVETRNDDDSNLNTSILGFPEENDWVFYGPYSDKSLMRNPLMFSIASDLNRYASCWQYFDLYINEQHQGIYVLLEKMKRDDFRININKLKESENDGEDVTGGYIIKIDKTVGDGNGTGDYNDTISFASFHLSQRNKKHHFLYDTPDADEITTEQKTYIQSYLHDFEDALQSVNFTDEEVGYRNYIDVDSFVDYFILNELGRNVDSYRLSTYLVKDKNAKLAMGPMWDLNLAFGNANYCEGDNVRTWAYEFSAVCPSDANPVPFWWQRLLSDPYFSDKVKSRWQALRLNVLSDEHSEAKINDISLLLEKSKSVPENFSVWGTLGEYVWPNAFIGESHQQEVDYLKTWLQSRVSWLDNNIPAL